MAGVENVVAPQGTAFTSDHARVIKRYAGEVVLCFDSDDAGQNAAVRSLDDLIESGLAIRVATVPAPHDPDTFIKSQGAEAFQALVDDAPGFFDFLLNRLCQKHPSDSDRGMLAIVRAMAEALKKTGSAVLMDMHAQKTASRLGISPDAVREEFKRIQGSGSFGNREVRLPEEEAQEAERPPAVELWLLKLLLSNPDLASWSMVHLKLDWIQHPQMRAIIGLLHHAVEHEDWRDVAGFVEDFEDATSQALITEAAAEARAIPNPAQQLLDVATKLRNTTLDVEQANLARQIGAPELSDTQRIELLRKQQNIRELRRQPLPTVGP